MVLVLLASLGVILFYQPAPEALPEVGRFLGRLHVLLLHFPIALLVVALLLGLSHWRPMTCCLPLTPPAVVLWLTGAGALSAWLAAVLGWLLAHSGGYEGQTVQRHFYAGVACAAAALMAWGLAQGWARQVECRLRYGATVAALGIANLLVIVAGHLGGTLTHGEHYLWEAAPGWVRQLAGHKPTPPKPQVRDLAGQPVYEAVIAPLLKQYCVECHQAEKAKGGLRLDAYAETLEVVRPGQPRDSELLKRVLLPLEDEDHMPPQGKPQPKAGEVAVLEWWIGAGAPEKATVGSLNPPPVVLQQLGME
ncbi:hypothetical protein NXS98_00640 [Fontisphaera persica]|uniref:c-type cytochrome domain-containing protein n=1 Tax=Fontisphaera persica TaxID=2974023 RepID=UPI0024BF913A|nr:c-type cytochrome domain-containing protein [Fontisphaera persica]WCJ59658.1 hypothetical protein NXS98_00640 [Fontisphaera persica]